MPTVTVDTSGPFFDGRADHEAQQGTNKVAEDVAKEGLQMVKSDLSRVIRTHPSGRYIPSVTALHTGQSSFSIGTRIVYGRWIEGTGSRNRTTRFKGYASFRRTAQVLNAKAGFIAERTMRPYVARM
jgi:hypothetical protein